MQVKDILVNGDALLDKEISVAGFLVISIDDIYFVASGVLLLDETLAIVIDSKITAKINSLTDQVTHLDSIATFQINITGILTKNSHQYHLQNISSIQIHAPDWGYVGCWQCKTLPKALRGRANAIDVLDILDNSQHYIGEKIWVSGLLTCHEDIHYLTTPEHMAKMSFYGSSLAFIDQPPPDPEVIKRERQQFKTQLDHEKRHSILFNNPLIFKGMMKWRAGSWRANVHILGTIKQSNIPPFPLMFIAPHILEEIGRFQQSYFWHIPQKLKKLRSRPSKY